MCVCVCVCIKPMDVCVHLSGQRTSLGTGLFTFIFWGLLCVAACAWLGGPQASGDSPVSDSDFPVGALKLQEVHTFWGCEGRSLALTSILPTEPPPSQHTWYLLMTQASEGKIKYSIEGECQMENGSRSERSKTRWKWIFSNVLVISLRILRTSFPWNKVDNAGEFEMRVGTGGP